MTETIKIFYNLFWQNAACRNLFLLSKEELLDTLSVDLEDLKTSITFPRIIISNVSKHDENHETIKYRTETSIIKSGTQISNKFGFYEPLLAKFIESKFGKSLERLVKDVNDSPGKFIKVLFKVAVSGDKGREKAFFELIHKYGFVGKHIKSFKELEDYFTKEGINKNLKNILTNENLWNLFEFLRAVKDIYVGEIYKELYSSSQILVNSLYEQDNFESRIKLFNHLFEAGIISPSPEDSFLECTHCSPGAYRGIMQLKTNPLKLIGFKCPICSSPLNYYVPYELHSDIFNIIRQPDGLLLDSLCILLKDKKIPFLRNQKFPPDIELDCEFTMSNNTYIVEAKMYKVNTTPEKLVSKLMEHYTKLCSNLERIVSSVPGYRNVQAITPVLLVNIPDIKIIDTARQQMSSGASPSSINIFNIEDMMKLLR